MTPEVVEQIAQQLHMEYRASSAALTAVRNNHNHGWKFCRNKAYFRARAQRMEHFIKAVVVQDSAVLAALKQLEDARRLLGVSIRAYGKLGAELRRAQRLIKGLLMLIEAATAAGFSIDQQGNVINKLAEKRPTRVIKLPNTTFYTSKITKTNPPLHAGGFPAQAGDCPSDCPCRIKRPKLETESDATGFSS